MLLCLCLKLLVTDWRLKTEDRAEQNRTEPPPTPTYIWLFRYFSSSLNISLFLSCFAYFLFTFCTHVAFTFVWFFLFFCCLFLTVANWMVAILSALLLKERMKNEDAMRTSRYGKSKCNVYTHRTLKRRRYIRTLAISD